MTTTSWTCDTCRNAILTSDDGWVEWLDIEDTSTGTAREEGLRLVHRDIGDSKPPCQYNQNRMFREKNATLKDLPLLSFLGPDGLMLLLRMLAEGKLPSDQVIELIKRLHIPGYEYVRLNLDLAANQFIFEPNMPPGFVRQSQISAVAKWMKQP